MNQTLLLPPVCFLIFFLAAWLFSKVISITALKGKASDKGREPYACGERNYDPMIQPNYSQFFPFALFFTLLHVAALTLATLPTIGGGTLVMAGIYIVSVIVGLSILYNR